MWVVCGYHEGKPIRRFAYHSNRSGSFAEELLNGFTGRYVQTDGFDGYNRLDGRSDLVHVGCFAHIRRKFVSAWETAGKTGIAKEAIDIIARLYGSGGSTSCPASKINSETFHFEDRPKAPVPMNYAGS
jgi:transposase